MVEQEHADTGRGRLLLVVGIGVVAVLLVIGVFLAVQANQTAGTMASARAWATQMLADDAAHRPVEVGNPLTTNVPDGAAVSSVKDFNVRFGVPTVQHLLLESPAAGNAGHVELIYVDPAHVRVMVFDPTTLRSDFKAALVEGKWSVVNDSPATSGGQNTQESAAQSDPSVDPKSAIVGSWNGFPGAPSDTTDTWTFGSDGTVDRELVTSTGNNSYMGTYQVTSGQGPASMQVKWNDRMMGRDVTAECVFSGLDKFRWGGREFERQH